MRDPFNLPNIDNASPACLPASTLTISSGTNVRRNYSKWSQNRSKPKISSHQLLASGWGLLETGGTSPDLLQKVNFWNDSSRALDHYSEAKYFLPQVTLSAESDSDCISKWGAVAAATICTSEVGGKGICQVNFYKQILNEIVHNSFQMISSRHQGCWTHCRIFETNLISREILGAL